MDTRPAEGYLRQLAETERPHIWRFRVMSLRRRVTRLSAPAQCRGACAGCGRRLPRSSRSARSIRGSVSPS
jgi:hypothetical protein